MKSNLHAKQIEASKLFSSNSGSSWRLIQYNLNKIQVMNGINEFLNVFVNLNLIDRHF